MHARRRVVPVVDRRALCEPQQNMDACVHDGPGTPARPQWIDSLKYTEFCYQRHASEAEHWCTSYYIATLRNTYHQTSVA